MSTLMFILYGVFCCCIGGFVGYFFTKVWYKRIINTMTIKNQNLIERVKKTESIVLHDLLQLSPDDISLLSRKTEGDVTKSTT